MKTHWEKTNFEADTTTSDVFCEPTHPYYKICCFFFLHGRYNNLNEDLTGGKGTMFHLAKVIDEERMI